MPPGNNTLERFKELFHQNADTIKLIAANFYAPDSFLFRSLTTDLTTHLWLTLRDMDTDSPIQHEQVWIYNILYNKALNLVRSEQHYQQHFIYHADLTSIPDIQERHPQTEQLYRLINRLNDRDKKLITMHLDGIPLQEIAAVEGKTTLQIHQHLLYLRKKLRKLNNTQQETEQ